MSINLKGSKLTFRAGRINLRGETTTETYSTNGWDISLLRGVSFSVASQDSSPSDVFFKPDGTKMYVLGGSNRTVYQYSLSTAWNLASATYDGVSYNAGISTTAGIYIRPDGRKMYITNSFDRKVYQYSLSTAWDMSTASNDYKLFSFGNQVSSPWAIVFKPDGTKMFMTGYGGKIHSYSLSTAWDVSTASYDGIFIDTASQENIPSGLSFKQDDGTRAYIVGESNDVLAQYNLSTGWDVSTGSFSGNLISINTIDLIPSGLFFKQDDGKLFYVAGDSSNAIHCFKATTGWDLSTSLYRKTYTSTLETTLLSIYVKPDGTKLYLVGSNQKKVYQYSLSTAWDVSTATYDNKFVDVSFEDFPNQIWFKPDGTRMYMIGSSTDKVYQYNLSTAWDVSTATLASNLSISDRDNLGQGVTFKPDGTKMFIVGENNKSVFAYTLSTAWDITTATYDGVSYSFSAQDNYPREVYLDPTGTKMYMLGEGSSSIHYYTLSTAWDISTILYSNKFFKLTNDGLVYPTALSVSPDGSKVYAAKGNKIVWIDLMPE